MLWGRSSTMLGTSPCKWSMTCPWRTRCMGRVETSLRDENYSQWSWLVSSHLTTLKFSTTLTICTCSATMEMTNSRPSTTSGLISYTTWKHDDRPSTNSLRDTLFRKIEHSKLMHFDISRYRTLWRRASWKDLWLPNQYDQRIHCQREARKIVERQGTCS